MPTASPPQGAFAQAGIDPSDIRTYAAAQLERAVRGAYGVTPLLVCSYLSRRRRWLLQEVRLCVGVDLQVRRILLRVQKRIKHSPAQAAPPLQHPRVWMPLPPLYLPVGLVPLLLLLHARQYCPIPRGVLCSDPAEQKSWSSPACTAACVRWQMRPQAEQRHLVPSTAAFTSMLAYVSTAGPGLPSA